MPGGDYPGTEAADTALVDIVLALRCNGMTSKAVNPEEQINDLNLFFVHKYYPSPATPEVRHYYFSSADIAKHIKLTNIRLGKYTMYAVANAGKKLCSDSHDSETPSAVGEGLCSMNEVQIKELVVRYSQEPYKMDNLLMSSVDPDMAVKRSDGTLPTITVNLVRKVARVDFSYKLVGPAIGKMSVKKIVLNKIPARTSPFVPSKPTSSTLYNSWKLCDFGIGTSENEYVVNPFYLPENIAGDVDGITSERDRHVKTAPSAASFLYIDGDYEGSQYGMSIYFGDDMQGGNFDVDGNAHYKMNLELGGPNLDDARVSSMALEVLQEATGMGTNEWTEMRMKIKCSNYFDDQLTLNCNVAYPSIGEVNGAFEAYKATTDGGDWTPLADQGNYRFSILNTTSQGSGEVWCKVRYKQEQPCQDVRLSLTVASRYGSTNFKDQKFDVVN